MSVQASSDEQLLLALRGGDEQAFRVLVRRYHRAMVRVAASFVPTSAIAEEVTQETWLAVIRGLDGFAGRSSLKTWIFRILVNRARSCGVRERRSVPVSALDSGETGTAPKEPAVDPGRFRGPGELFEGYWSVPPTRWPEQRVLDAETRAIADRAIGALPLPQRQVITLRDVEGWSAPEVCECLGLTEVNQRVLLHRARARVRAALEVYFAGGTEA